MNRHRGTHFAALAFSVMLVGFSGSCQSADCNESPCFIRNLLAYCGDGAQCSTSQGPAVLNGSGVLELGMVEYLRVNFDPAFEVPDSVDTFELSFLDTPSNLRDAVHVSVNGLPCEFRGTQGILVRRPDQSAVSEILVEFDPDYPGGLDLVAIELYNENCIETEGRAGCAE